METAPKQTRIKYKTSHPLYGDNNIFDSWMTLCEYTVELAQEHISSINAQRLKELSEEMMNTAIEFEYEP